MASTFKAVPPNRWFALGSTSVTGTVDATYDPDHLVDGRTSFPVRRTGSSISLAIAGTAQDVDVLCVGHHNIRPAASVNVTGDITQAITIPAWPPNNIPLNGVAILGATVTGVDALTLAVTGQTETSCIIGEFCAGLSITLPRTLATDTRFGHLDFRSRRAMDRAHIPPTDKKAYARFWEGTCLWTTAQKNTAQEWFESQMSGTKPSLIIPDTTVNDAWFVQFIDFDPIPMRGGSSGVPSLWKVHVRFEEYARTRW